MTEVKWWLNLPSQSRKTLSILIVIFTLMYVFKTLVPRFR